MISARASLSMSRQVFFVSTGGFDTHDDLVADQPGLLGNVSNSIKSFYDALAEIGMENSVTLFTHSDFGRTLTSNGDGSDHAWGGVQFVVGGAVRGQQVYGQYPLLSIGSAQDVGGGRFIPTTSADQYAATLAQLVRRAGRRPREGRAEHRQLHDAKPRLPRLRLRRGAVRRDRGAPRRDRGASRRRLAGSARYDGLAMNDPWSAIAASLPELRDRAPRIAGADPVVPTPFRVGAAASAAIGAAAAAAATLGELRGLGPQQAIVDLRQATAALTSFLWLKVDGAPFPAPQGELPTMAIYRCADGRWIHLHGALPRLRDGTLALLGCEDRAASIAAAVARWPSFALEDALAAAGQCGAVLRSAAEWAAHPQGQALADAAAGRTGADRRCAAARVRARRASRSRACACST